MAEYNPLKITQLKKLDTEPLQGQYRELGNALEEITRRKPDTMPETREKLINAIIDNQGTLEMRQRNPNRREYGRTLSKKIGDKK